MVCRKPTKKRMYFGNFQTLRDYVSMCGASCSFTGLPTKYCSPEWKLGRDFGPFCDGDTPGYTPASAAFGPRLSIPLEGSIGLIKRSFFYRIYCVVMGLLGTHLSACMYQQGYDDANRLLIPALLGRVPPPPPDQARSNGTPAQQAILEALPSGFAQPHEMAAPFLPDTKETPVFKFRRLLPSEYK